MLPLKILRPQLRDQKHLVQDLRVTRNYLNNDGMSLIFLFQRFYPQT